MSEEEKAFQHFMDQLEKKDMKITFGLKESDIQKIEQELTKWDAIIADDYDLRVGWGKYNRHFWEKMGKELSWCPLTLALWYFKKETK